MYRHSKMLLLMGARFEEICCVIVRLYEPIVVFSYMPDYTLKL